MATEGSSSGAGGSDPNGDVDDDGGVDNLWDSTLVFKDLAIERRHEYEEETLVAKTKHEEFVHQQGMIPATVLAISQWRSISWMGLFWLLANSLLGAPTAWFMARRRKSFYMKYRTPLVVVLMLHTMLVYCFVAEDAPSPRWYKILGRIALRSPCGVAVFFALNFSIGFRRQIVVQICTVPGLIAWASKFCVACGSGNPTPLDDELERMGYILGNCLWMFQKVDKQGGPVYGCFVVVGMIVLVMGFLIPLLLVYLVEVVRRESFAIKHFPELANSRALEQTISDSRQKAAFYFIAGMEVAWIVCRLLGESWGD
ncbi:hypothetical protein BSKO_08759 [Bryopsis sp. KO-2023]|nr:hypothetical protein BSKO_08759 [Bryopsis sp. KO-2023]